MDTLEAIATRRSVRQFNKDKPVEQEKIAQILKAAMSAPSARNEQAWHFIVIDQRKLLDELPNLHPYADMCLQAPLAIICCADISIPKDEKFWAQDLSAASQNILLAARALDLGSVWLGVYPQKDRIEDIQKRFNLPKNIIPFNIIPIGYSGVKQKAADRFQENRIHYNEAW